MRNLTRISSALNDVSLAKKGTAVVLIPIAVLLITLLLKAWHEKESRFAQARVTQSLEIKASLARLQALVTDSETAVRGYLLWNSPIYLKPYNDAVYQIIPEVNKLRDLVKDNADQTSKVAAIESAATEKVGILSTILGNPEIAQDISGPVASRGRESMANLRSLIFDTDMTEQMLLQRSIKAYDKIISKINFILISLFMLALLCGLTASYIVSMGILKRVNELEHYARRVSRGKPAEWEGDGEDEIGQLGRSVEIMTKNLLSREKSLEQTRGELEAANSNLKLMLAETRASNQELESFSYSVSHDLRAPLRHVSGFSELMLRNADSLDAKNKRYLDIISSSIKQMGTLIDDLLAFSRMGRTSLKTDVVDLNDVINSVLRDLSPDITDREINWSIPELPKIRGDQVMIQLVFQNLLGNALKYTRLVPPTSISIETTYLPNTQMQAITIIDNGVGFDMAYQGKLFGVFQRLHSSDDYEGTGIGLATVRRIVLRHGGHVSAESAVNQGARFTVTLPADKEG